MPKPQPKDPALSDADFSELERKVNAAIHELVFAMKHAEDDQLEDASNCLMTAQGTIEEVALEIVAANAGGES